MTERKEKLKEIYDKIVETNGNALRRLAESDKFETNTERLTRIKEAPLKLINEGLGEMDIITECVVDYRDYLWLIGQVYELREKNFELLDLNDITPYQISMLKDENKRLRNTLKFYANKENYVSKEEYQMENLPSNVEFECGEKARQALIK